MNSDDESGDATPFVDNLRLYIPLNDLEDNETRRKSMTMQSQFSQSLDVLGPPLTIPEENSRLTRQYLSLFMSIIYAVLLVSLGILFLRGEPSDNTSLIYSISLCGIGFIYILYLIIDVTRFNSNSHKNQRIKELNQEEMVSLGSSDAGSPVFTPTVPPPELHQYCFSHGRHAESFYLKMGAVVFAIGHLVHSVLEIIVNLGFIFDENINNDDCLNLLAVVLDFMLPCYCITQLFFMFKYSNLIILKSKCLAYFAFMHMIGTSLCFWILTIARETKLILTIYAYAMYGNGTEVSEKRTVEEIFIKKLYRENCNCSPALSAIIVNLSPYLFPFTVEFYILIVAVYYIVWSNIGNCENDNTYTKTKSRDHILSCRLPNEHEEDDANDNTYSKPDSSRDHLSCRPPNANEDDDRFSKIVIHADCSKSIRGLFAGIILMVFVIGMLILGFVLGTVGGKFQKLGYLLKDVLKLGIHSSMLIATIIAFKLLKKLDINKHTAPLLDDVLLFICLPAFFMETVLSMIATVNIVNVIKCTDVTIMIVQVVIQTPLIMDGLRRCSNSKKLRRSKPGREVLMFLLIANVCMWLFNTFSYKSPDSLDERYEYYGKVLWTVLSHISLPLIMFYRFHSSVCFADIWDSAYKPGSEH